MKIIDKTPLQDENGNIGFAARVKGTLKYGLNWFAEMQAQKIAVAMLDRGLEKSFVLIRNFNLPGSEIIIPLILIGLGGIYIIYVTNAKGQFQAKGDQWNTVDTGGNAQPANVNPLALVTKYTRAFQKYLEINKIKIPGNVEPILIAIDPGAHIESTRPVAKVVKSDAVKVFINSLLQATPIWRSEQIYVLAERLLEPRRDEPAPAEPVAPVESSAAYAPTSFAESAPEKSFDANDLGFAFEEDNAAAPEPVIAQQPAPRPRPASKPAKKQFFGMSATQVTVLAGMFVLWCCLMGAFGFFLYLNQ